MAFEVFDAYGAATRPEATLRASGYLFLSRGITKRAGNENATHAQLLYDESSDRLGIKLGSEVDALVDGGYREASREKSGIAVNLLPLLRYYRLPIPKYVGKQVLPVEFDGGMIVIELKPLRVLAEQTVQGGEEKGEADLDEL